MVFQLSPKLGTELDKPLYSWAHIGLLMAHFFDKGEVLKKSCKLPGHICQKIG